MKHLLLLIPLLFAATATTSCQTYEVDESSTARSLDEETRAVTLDITGMT